MKRLIVLLVLLSMVFASCSFGMQGNNGVTVSGDESTSEITIGLDGSVLRGALADSGNATGSGNWLTIAGAGNVTTSASGSTVIVSCDVNGGNATYSQDSDKLDGQHGSYYFHPADADGDTKIQLEESADDDSFRVDVKGSEALLINSAGVITSALQSGTRIYQAGAQNIGFQSWVKCLLDTDAFDVQSESDLTNHRITVKTAGLYVCVGFVYYGSGVDGKTIYAGIYKNNVQQAVNLSYASVSSGDMGCQVFTVLQLAVGDYIELFTWQNLANPKAIAASASGVWLAVLKVA